jgi:hypothetical protein
LEASSASSWLNPCTLASDSCSVAATAAKAKARAMNLEMAMAGLRGGCRFRMMVCVEDEMFSAALFIVPLVLSRDRNEIATLNIYLSVRFQGETL